MNYGSIADIFSANERARERFLKVVDLISSDLADALPAGEKWTASQIVEHVAAVEQSILRVCNKLTAEARESGRPSDGSFQMSDEFREKLNGAAEAKFEAPQRVHPASGHPITVSLASLAETSAAFNDLRGDLSFLDGSSHRFPHPHFGPLTAAEWLVVLGGHERRHADQIERLLAKLRQ